LLTQTQIENLYIQGFILIVPSSFSQSFYRDWTHHEPVKSSRFTD